MKHTLSIIIALLFTPILTVQADNLTRNISIVPTPVQIVPGEGNYRFSDKTVFAVENAGQAEIARNFIAFFTRSAGFTPLLKEGTSDGDVCFVTDRNLKSEAYQLDITPNRIVMKASDVKGFFYALQTVRLLLPPSIENARNVGGNPDWSVPSVRISDEPRFGYRGLLLDAARFFIPKENVLRIIDCMAMLKLNTLHFHLCDDNGWRLEIKKHPRLTETGAWRVDRTDVPFHSRRNPEPGESTPLGGFYTQEDMKEMVAYAAERQIEVIPEIEMPAHSNAALASYPELACPVVKNFIGVLPGLGGANAGITYCAGNDSVFTFLQDVIDEVVELFPSRYIHLGGDEANKRNWKKCPLCQARMKKEHLADEEDLQGYFMKRMCEYAQSKGKEVIGWDELTNAAIPEGTIILGWQGMATAALKAAELGHRFIMTPARVMYLIRYQGPQWFEPVTYFGNITLKNVFDYEPIQEDWKPEYKSLLMGVQGCMWTEFCNKPEDVDYLLFPRLAAVAEGAWAKPEVKDWNRFLKGLDGYNRHIAAKGVRYSRSMYNIQHTVTSENGVLQVELECIRPDVEIHYTLDTSEPSAKSPHYTKKLIVDGAQTIKCATFEGGKQMGKTLILPLVRNKATGKPVLGDNKNEKVLTNGVRGSLKQTDFEWASWEKSDRVTFTVDLQKKEILNTFTLGCITNYGMAIHKPASIKVEVSDDNRKFRTAGTLSFTPEEIFREGNFVEDVSLKMGGIQGRYIRVTAQGPGVCPDSHVRPGQESRVMFDEMIIE
ncbi:glycoside hydrolase family 20 protein [Bacteroides sp.]